MVTPVRERLAALYELAPHDPARSYTMEGMRGLAVLLVFAVHFVSNFRGWVRGEVTHQITDLMHGIGHAGVDLFFVLSGYLIYAGVIRGKATPYVAYMRRRLRRIYPTFFVVFLLYLALSVAVPSKSKIPEEPVDAVLYLGANLLLLPGMFEIPPLNVVTWSLSFEFFYYLTIPVLVGLLAMRRWPTRNRIALFLALSAGWFTFCLTTQSLRTRLLMFVPGILLYEILHRDGRKPRGERAPGIGEEIGGFVVLVVGLGLAYVLDPGDGRLPFFPHLGSAGNALRILVLFVTLGVFVGIALRSHGTGPLGRLLSWRPLRWWGNMSYSYYLIHGVTILFVNLVLEKVVPDHLKGDVTFWLAFVVTLAATLVVSTILFLAVERPVSLSVPPRPPFGLGRWISPSDHFAPPMHVTDVDPTRPSGESVAGRPGRVAARVRGQRAARGRRRADVP